MSKKLAVSDEYSPVFNRIILECEAKRTTVSTLLDMFATSRSAIGAWKKGNISAETIANIADALNVSLDYLIRGQEQQKITPELSEIENALIYDFRSLSKQGQDYVRQQMFMAKEVYKKPALSEADMKTA